jgi:hypothetical protein
VLQKGSSNVGIVAVGDLIVEITFFSNVAALKDDY